MKRILTVLTVALVMAAILVVSGLPVVAAPPPREDCPVGPGQLVSTKQGVKGKCQAQTTTVTVTI